MNGHVGGLQTEAERFERLYAGSEDPWDYCTSPYERRKYAATLTALPDRPLGRVLELGCSIGVFTALLAGRASEVVGLDFSSRAIELATLRAGSRPNVTLLQGAFPGQTPPGRWDVIVCSEILYYLPCELLLVASDWIEDQLQGGACVLAVSWRGGSGGEPFTGDEVHDHLARRFAGSHALDARRAEYRLDRFDGRRPAP